MHQSSVQPVIIDPISGFMLPGCTASMNESSSLLAQGFIRNRGEHPA